jgi:hypothetical protein
MKKSYYVICILILFSGHVLRAQEDEVDENYAVSDTLSDNFGLFTHSDLIELTLRFDMTEYTREKPKEEYLDALLTYHINNKDSINREIRLKSRGEFRNGYCNFPPIMVNFKKSDFQKEDLAKIRKMKLVTHCTAGNERNLLEEYLIYKMYNVFTDSSFRVRLLKINYVNTSKKKKTVTTYGFFIEPLDMLAERINCTPVEALHLTQKNIDPRYMDQMALFNYMIGNTDWSVPNQHNCKVLTIPGSPTAELGLVIPYDFDYSGIVNAHYAVPAEGLKITSVTERIYQGRCPDEARFRPLLDEYESKKDALYKLIREFPYLEERDRKNMIRYLDEFFSDLSDRDKMLSIVRRECKEM